MQIAGLRVGEEAFRPLANPFNRLAKVLRSEGAKGVFFVLHDFHAKAAADIRRMNAQPFGFDLQRPGDAATHCVGALTADPGLPPFGFAVIADQDAARLHRRDDQALVDDAGADDMRGGGEGGLGLLLFADGPVVALVSGRFRMEFRRAVIQRGAAVHDGVEFCEIDLDHLTGVFGLIQSVGDDEGDCLPNIADGSV